MPDRGAIGAPRSKRKRGASGVTLAGSHEPSKRALYHCNYCEKDISNTVRIKCAVCPDFDLCLECFSVGVEITPHRNDHAYRVVDSLAFPLFHPNWGADEELLLVEAIDMYGLGNWDAVAEHVGTKSRGDCSEHYFSIYIQSPSFPRPTPVPEMLGIDAHAWVRERQRSRRSDAGLGSPNAVRRAREAAAEQSVVSGAPAVEAPGSEALQARVKAEVKAEEAVLSGEVAETGGLEDAARQGSTAGTGLSALEGVAAEAADDAMGDGRRAKKVRPAHGAAAAGEEGPSGADEPHMQNGGPSPAVAAAAGVPAHVLTGGMRIHAREPAAGSGEPPPPGSAAAPDAGETLLKLGSSQIDITGFHAKRCEFEFEYDNAAEAVVADLEFKEEDSAEETAAKLRLVQIYNDRLTEREQRRAFIIERGLLNVRRQQASEKKRTPAEREAAVRVRVFARFLPRAVHEALADGLLLEHRLRARIQELKELRRAGVRTFSDAELYESRKRRRLDRAAAAATGKAGARLEEAVVQGTPAGNAAANGGLAAPGGTPLPGGGLRSAGSGVGLGPVPGALPLNLGGSALEARGAASALAAWRAARGYNLDITQQPGLELLSSKERELCAGARLLPAHYLLLKAALMREAERRGGPIPRLEARTMFRLEPARALRVFDLLVACGWIPGLPNCIPGEKSRLAIADALAEAMAP